jgi:hypothetical protein
MKFATVAALGVVGATLAMAPLAPAQAHGFCGPLLPLCVAGAVVGAAATVATLPFAAAAAVTAPGYYAPPAYYPAAPAYYSPYPAPAYYPPAPAYYAPAPAYYAPGYYPGPVAYYGWYGHRGYYGGGFYGAHYRGAYYGGRGRYHHN